MMQPAAATPIAADTKVRYYPRETPAGGADGRLLAVAGALALIVIEYAHYTKDDVQPGRIIWVPLADLRDSGR